MKYQVFHSLVNFAYLYIQHPEFLSGGKQILPFASEFGYFFQENRIAVAAEIEGLIEEIYERLDCIREPLREVDGSLANRAERYWLAHIDGALFNRSGVLGGSFITAADTLEELEEGEKV